MSREPTCRNGHPIITKDNGWCLKCKAFVHVPRRDLSDESALRFLGTYEVPAKPQYPELTAMPRIPKKICGNCHQQIDSKICPHCNTYVGR